MNYNNLNNTTVYNENRIYHNNEVEESVMNLNEMNDYLEPRIIQSESYEPIQNYVNT